MSQENVEIVRRMYEAFNRWGSTPGECAIPRFRHSSILHTYARLSHKR